MENLFCVHYVVAIDTCFPVSFENLQKKGNRDCNILSSDVLFANEGLLAYEVSNEAVIDSGCSSTVAGKDWVKVRNNLCHGVRVTNISSLVEVKF